MKLLRSMASPESQRLKEAEAAIRNNETAIAEEQATAKKIDADLQEALINGKDQGEVARLTGLQVMTQARLKARQAMVGRLEGDLLKLQREAAKNRADAKRREIAALEQQERDLISEVRKSLASFEALTGVTIQNVRPTIWNGVLVLPYVNSKSCPMPFGSLPEVVRLRSEQFKLKRELESIEREAEEIAPGRLLPLTAA